MLSLFTEVKLLLSHKGDFDFCIFFLVNQSMMGMPLYLKKCINSISLNGHKQHFVVLSTQRSNLTLTVINFGDYTELHGTKMLDNFQSVYYFLYLINYPEM